MSEIRADKLHNASGDNDSGIDLSTNDQVVIKTADTTAVTVDSSQNTTLAGNLTLTSTDGDASSGPRMELIRNSDSAANGDSIGLIVFKAADASGNTPEEVIQFLGVLEDSTNGAEDASLDIRTIVAGNTRSRIDFEASETVFNQEAIDLDFRVESASGNTNNTDSLKVVASNGQIFSTALYNWTTSASANVVVTGSAGHLARSTSALKYKKEVRDLEEIDIDSFRPVRYKSRSDIDNQDKDNFGFIADEVHDAGITELVTYDGDVVEGFQYERLTAVLVKTLQEQKKTIKELEARITALESE